MEHIKNPHETGGEGKQPSWVGSGYTKLYIWTLTEYQKVIKLHLSFKVFYVDADCMIMSNPEEGFLRDVEFAAAPDIFPPDRFNAGVLLIVRPYC